MATSSKCSSWGNEMGADRGTAVFLTFMFSYRPISFLELNTRLLDFAGALINLRGWTRFVCFVPLRGEDLVFWHIIYVRSANPLYSCWAALACCLRGWQRHAREGWGDQICPYSTQHWFWIVNCCSEHGYNTYLLHYISMIDLRQQTLLKWTWRF